MGGLGNILPFWKSITTLLAPVLLCPLVFYVGTQEAKCGFVILVMAVFWVTDAVPLPVTALLPVILLPLFGIMTTDQVCITYLKESNMMFIGSLIVAISVEKCLLHQRIALKALLTIGTSPRMLMLGLMLPTMFLSMWISNTATTSMMVPIVEAIVSELDEEIATQAEDSQKTGIKRQKDKQRIRVMLFLAVAYAANNGGVGTLTGTGPNLVFKGMIGTLFGSETPVNFASWMLFAMPTVIINLLLCWLWLQVYFIGLPCSKSAVDFGKTGAIKSLLEKKYQDLGPMTFQQMAVLGHFIILVLLWFFREPRFMPGWGDLFLEETTDLCGNIKHTQIVDDATSSMLIVFLLFIFPSELIFWPFTSWKDSRSSPSLLDWPYVQKRFPWGVAILFGGGFALAAASKKSGLSDWVGTELKVLDSLPDWAMVVVICVLVGIITEITSNVATANILLPVLAEVGHATGTNPLYLMIPATVTCSYAFMLPVATPPNAIAHEASGMKTSQMMGVGLVMNIVCITINMVAINTYGVWMFGLDQYPEWANASRIISTSQC